MILQVWGGLFYLTNKVCFSVAEGKPEKAAKRLRLAGWLIYILGVPAWVILLVMKHNWIAASIEAGGLPAMLLGLYNVHKDGEGVHPFFGSVTSGLTYAFMVFGVGYSLYDYNGLVAVTQLLEMGVMVGFLMGSYFMAKGNISGWLFFMLMNVSMGALMGIQGKPVLACQQVLSLGFVVYGFIGATGKRRRKG